MDYTGYVISVLTDEQLADYFSSDDPMSYLKEPLLENQYWVVYNTKGEVVDKRVFRKEKLERLIYPSLKSHYTGEVKPRNIQQHLLFDMYNNEDLTIKLATGRFGSGKTFSMVTAAMSALESGKFEKIVWVRNNVDVKDTVPLGALPGDEYAKLLPFVMPLADHCGGIDGIQRLLEKGQLEIVHLGFLRGRDIRNSIIMCTEAENLTKEHIQLIIGRVGEGSVLYMDADLKQRDKTAFEKSGGLEKMVDSLKGNNLFGYVHLVKSERSETARLADLMD